MTLDEIKTRKEALRKLKDEINASLKTLRMEQATKEAEVVEVQRQITEACDQVVALEQEMDDLSTAERIMLTTAPAGE
uniref:Uncharacterized protein n=1 Tax=Firmicutes phage HS11 TaxID=3056393 RepID=A0AA49X402_9VIRU|nr:MAG: hypothetical protein [Firmicutes phage HS11]